MALDTNLVGMVVVVVLDGSLGGNLGLGTGSQVMRAREWNETMRNNTARVTSSNMNMTQDYARVQSKRLAGSLLGTIVPAKTMVKKSLYIQYIMINE